MDRFNCTPMMQAFCHLDLLSARSSEVVGSMPFDSRLAFKLSLKCINGRQFGLVPKGNFAQKVTFGILLTNIQQT